MFADPPYAMEQVDLDALVAALNSRRGPLRPRLAGGPDASQKVFHACHSATWLAARRLSYGDTLVFIFREV